MAATLRAVRALLLLAGFYLMNGVLLAALLGLDVFLVVEGLRGHALLAVGKLLILSLALTYPIVQGMFAFRRPGKGSDGPSGQVVTPEQQPELWAEIREAARRSGTRPPHALTLTGDVNAAVAERTHLLGLIAGRRRMYLGVPLLAGLTLPRLRAVLAHEFGHYGHQDTRLATLTMRGREGVTRTVDAFRAGASGGSRMHAVVGNLYLRYARLYLRISQSVARGQELAADQAAARLAGRDTTAAALREIPVLTTAFGFYVERYATVGWQSSLRPSAGEFYGGFRHLLADPGRGAELASMRAELPEAERSPYDSHPPIADRVRLIESLPADGRPDDPTAPLGLSLLRDRDAVLAALESVTLVAGARGMRQLGWKELAAASGRATCEEAARPLREAVSGADGSGATSREAAGAGRGVAPAKGLGSLDDVLRAIEEGRLWTVVARRLPKSEQAARATGRAAREFVRPALREGLSALAHLTLADAGRARWELSWSAGPVHAVLPEGYEEALPSALDAAVADVPDAGPLRALLATGLAATATAPPAAPLAVRPAALPVAES
jgi:Zn-dependent protease with chaperone function